MINNCVLFFQLGTVTGLVSYLHCKRIGKKNKCTKICFSPVIVLQSGFFSLSVSLCLIIFLVQFSPGKTYVFKYDVEIQTMKDRILPLARAGIKITSDVWLSATNKSVLLKVTHMTCVLFHIF